jgi:hypothetical protein
LAQAESSQKSAVMAGRVLNFGTQASPSLLSKNKRIAQAPGRTRDKQLFLALEKKTSGKKIVLFFIGHEVLFF